MGLLPPRPQEVQRSRHRRPDVTGLPEPPRGFSVRQLGFDISTAQTASQPTHCRLQSAGPPEAQGATKRGWFLRVRVPELLRGQVCACVLLEAGPWEPRVGAS